MSRPSIALCVPAYNAAGFIPRLLRSAAAQAPPFDEIIVCDDASTDNTAQIAREHGAKVVFNEKNAGCSASKNRALQMASSGWVHFHDADDDLLPNFTALAQKWISRDDAPDVVVFDYEYRDDQTRELIAKSDFDDQALQKDPLRYAILNKINAICGLYRRSKLLAAGGYDTDPEVLYNEDVAFHCKLARAGFTFRAEKEVSIVNYRIGNSMSTANAVKCLKAHYAVMRKITASHGGQHPAEIASRLWVAATGLAAYSEWASMDAALADARKLYSGVPFGESARFGSLCRLIGPRLAFRVREHAIRLFKPHLRRLNK